MKIIILSFLLLFSGCANPVKHLKIGDCLQFNNDIRGITYKITQLGKYSVRALGDDNKKYLISQDDLKSMYIFNNYKKVDCFDIFD